MLLNRAYNELIVSANKVKWILNTLKPFKAAGRDKISPVIVQEGAKVLLKPLVNVFRDSMIF